jgi:hypothetical protein
MLTLCIGYSDRLGLMILEATQIISELIRRPRYQHTLSVVSHFIDSN